MIAALLLAAGASRRFGAPKLLATLHGEPLVRRAARALIAGGIESILVVTGDDGPLVREALAGLPLAFVDAPAHAEGMSASLRAGIAALPPDVTGVLVALGDQPTLDPDVVRAIATAFAQRAPAIVAPRYRGALANPVLFSRQLFPELEALRGDAGARRVVLRDPSRVGWIDVDSSVPADVDTPADLQQLEDAGE